MGELDALLSRIIQEPMPLQGQPMPAGTMRRLQVCSELLTAWLNLEQMELAGDIVFFCLPAEEYVEIEYRRQLVWRENNLSCWKTRTSSVGYFDDVDMAIMIHSSSSDHAEGSMGVASSSNGFLAKTIAF